MIRTLHVTHRSAVKAAAQAKNQLHAEIKTAPDQLRAELRELTWAKLRDRCASLRPGEIDDVTAAVKFTLGSLARRVIALEPRSPRSTGNYGRWSRHRADAVGDLRGRARRRCDAAGRSR